MFFFLVLTMSSYALAMDTASSHFSTLQAFSSRVSVLYLSPSIIDAISPFLFLLFLELYLPHFRSYNQNTVIPWLLSL